MKASEYFLADVICFAALPAHAQSNFSAATYRQFMHENRNLSSGTLLFRHAPKFPYFKSQSPVLTGNYAYLDSISIKMRLTDSEKNILFRNGFLVTKRQSFPSVKMLLVR